MGLFKRATDVIRANLNDLIKDAEDPEKMINLYLEDAKAHLVESKQAYHTSLSSQKLIESKYEENQKEADKWQKRAEIYVTKGDDALAKEALTEKKAFEAAANTLKESLEKSKVQTKNDETMVHDLQEKIRYAEINATVLIARAQSAKAHKKTADALAGISSSDPLGAIKGMEDKVSQMEASAEASADIAGISESNPEKKFRDLEAGDVDADLEALKEKMKPSQVQ